MGMFLGIESEVKVIRVGKLEIGCLFKEKEEGLIFRELDSFGGRDPPWRDSSD